MRPVEFAPEEIIQAGHELQAAGRNITGFAIRQKIGGGNPGRLRQVWDDFLNSKTEAKAEPVTELPSELAEEIDAVNKALAGQLTQFAIAANDKAVKAAERRVADVLTSAAEHREQAERELVDASQAVEDLETRLDEAVTNAEELGNRLAQAKADNQAQAVKLAQLEERLAQIEKERHNYEQQAELMRNERDTSRESAARLSGQIEALQAEVKDLMQTLSNSAGRDADNRQK